MEKFMNKLLELFEESVILQGIITVALIGTYCYLTIIGRAIPDGLNNLTLAVLYFWFGTKSQAAASSMAKRLGNGSSSSSPGTADSNRVV